MAEAGEERNDDDLSETSEDDCTSEDEGTEDYRRGGYHAVRIGDLFKHGWYSMQSKLGSGHFSTVWLAWDTQKSVVDTRQSLRSGLGPIYAQPAYTGIGNVMESVYKQGGVRALYRGVGPTLIGILPYAGLKFYIYEELKRHVPEEHQTSIVMRLSCGALAGLFGQTFTYPLDVVRRQTQVPHNIL